MLKWKWNRRVIHINMNIFKMVLKKMIKERKIMGIPTANYLFYYCKDLLPNIWMNFGVYANLQLDNFYHLKICYKNNMVY
jgi:hypothetical protein